jgi:hypothetical protein
MRACSSAGERLSDVQEAGGSRPSSPTITTARPGHQSKEERVVVSCIRCGCTEGWHSGYDGPCLNVGCRCQAYEPDWAALDALAIEDALDGFPAPGVTLRHLRPASRAVTTHLVELSEPLFYWPLDHQPHAAEVQRDERPLAEREEAGSRPADRTPTELNCRSRRVRSNVQLRHRAARGRWDNADQISASTHGTRELCDGRHRVARADLRRTLVHRRLTAWYRDGLRSNGPCPMCRGHGHLVDERPAVAA